MGRRVEYLFTVCPCSSGLQVQCQVACVLEKPGRGGKSSAQRLINLTIAQESMSGTYHAAPERGRWFGDRPADQICALSSTATGVTRN